MRRLYYVAVDLDTTGAISKRLHAEGISDWNFHVLARDHAGLYTHHIHSALPHHHKDLIRTGERGFLYGGVLGCILAVGLFLLGTVAAVSTWVDVAMVSLIGALAGGLLGIRVGMKRDNVRMAGFQQEIERGRYLIMVDVAKLDKPKIRELMNMEFPGVDYRGNESTFVRPFKADERILPQPMRQ